MLIGGSLAFGFSFYPGLTFSTLVLAFPFIFVYFLASPDALEVIDLTDVTLAIKDTDEDEEEDEDDEENLTDVTLVSGETY